MTEIYFAKVRETATIPNKLDENGGYDVFADFSEENLVIPPFSNALVSTGIASAFDDTHFFLLEERGSTGVKNMKRSAGVIDSGFRAEWKVVLYNGNDKPLLITKETNKETLEILKAEYVVYEYNKAICQALFLPVPKPLIKELKYEDLLTIPSKRGLGMLGSSGK